MSETPSAERRRFVAQAAVVGRCTLVFQKEGARVVRTMGARLCTTARVCGSHSGAAEPCGSSSTTLGTPSAPACMSAAVTWSPYAWSRVVSSSSTSDNHGAFRRLEAMLFTAGRSCDGDAPTHPISARH